ncbi:MAG: hypothetical protein AAB649_06215, partial [Patescibacteria group bacterium]
MPGFPEYIKTEYPKIFAELVVDFETGGTSTFIVLTGTNVVSFVNAVFQFGKHVAGLNNGIG